MNENITHIKLDDFIKFSQENRIDFAKYTYNCGAHKFVDQTCETDWKTDRFISTYNFKEIYLNKNNYGPYLYYVLSIIGKTYLMYEARDEITIWVCYTEKKYRNNGHMGKLLKYLIELYPEKRMTIDTFSESLRNICTNLGINLFKR